MIRWFTMLAFGLSLGWHPYLSAQMQADAIPGTTLSLTAGAGGSLELPMVIAGEDAIFLLDTGASMVTINSALYRRVQARGGAREVREVAGRMADGRARRLHVYEIDDLRIGEDYYLGAVEVVVVPGKGRNLLGLNALRRFAPLTLGMTPPSLALSGCSGSEI